MTTTSTTAAQQAVVEDWIAATDALDLERYLAHFTDDAVLDDPSVGAVFTGHDGIADYFRSYFLGYRTRTRLVRTVQRGARLRVEVDFTGDFPGGRTDGFFEVTFAGDLIAHVHADLA